MYSMAAGIMFASAGVDSGASPQVQLSTSNISHTRIPHASKAFSIRSKSAAAVGHKPDGVQSRAPRYVIPAADAAPA